MYGLRSVFIIIRFEAGDHFPIVRRKHFTIVEILAFTGGLLGLFLGISVVTCTEILSMLLNPLFNKLSILIYSQKRRSFFKKRRNIFFAFMAELRSYFSSYLQESSIHSFNFITESANCFERIFWILSFSLSMTGSSLMILQLYRTIDFKSVMVNIDDPMEVTEIPFPAVTVFGRFPSAFKIRFPEMQSSDELTHADFLKKQETIEMPASK